MTQATILLAALLIGFLIDRQVAERRPGLFRPIMWAVGAALLAPVAIGIVHLVVNGADAFAIRFTAFSVSELLLGYMFASGSWALRVLASARAGYR